MSKKVVAIIISILILASHFGATLFLRVHGEEKDVLTALREMEEELEKGRIPSGSITEANFIIPEGFPIELAKRLWLFTAQLISTGSSRDEIRQAIIDASDTLRLPARVSYELKNYTIIPEYGKARVVQRNDGSVSVEVPYRVIDSRGRDIDASSIRYESNGTNLFHVLYRHPKKRTYLVRAIDPDAYTFTFIDLKTGQVFNKTARINIGLFPNVAQGGVFKSFIVAVPGHFEETREIVGSQVCGFKVLLPAHDPLVVDTSISPTRVKVGDVITVSAQIRNPQEAKNFQVLLAARLSEEDVFEAWAPPPVGFPHGSGCPVSYLYLRAKRPGVYQITVYFAVVEPKNLDVVFWNGEKTVTYVVTVLPEPPKLRVELEAHALAKFANLSITLVNIGGQEANGVKLFVTGDVEEKELDVGRVWHTWEVNVITRLLSPNAKVNVTLVYYDLEGKKHANSVLTTISTTNFVTPEEWRTYLIEVPGYEETKRVFIPSYEAATHVKPYLMRIDLAPPHVVNYFNGLSLIPISTEGFTLTLENASNISEIASKVPEARYMLVDVKPSFLCERILREDELKRLFHIGEDEKLEPRKIPAGYEVRLLKEEVLNQSEIVTVDDDFYGQLKYSGWEDYDYKYEDTGVKKWDLNKATTRVTHGKTMELIYHPLLCQGDLIKGVLVKNYATREIRFELEILQGPMAEALPENVVLSVPAYGSVPLNIIQLSSMNSPILIRMRYEDRVVASLWVHASSGVSEFWRGFWDGINEKLPGIIVTTTVMIVLAAPTGGGSLLAYLKKLLASGVIPSLMLAGATLNAGEFFEAHSAYVKMDEAAEMLEAFSQRAAYAGYMSFYALLQGLKNSIKEKQWLILGATGLDLIGDVAVRDVLIAFGKKDATEYERGRAIGRLVGAAASFTSYTYTHYRFLSNGPRLLSWGGKIKEFLKGVYNWITPPIWDLGVLAGKLAASEIAASLALSEQNQKLKNYLNSVREDEESLSTLLKSLKYSDEYVGKALDIAGGLKLCEGAFLSLLRAYGETVERLGDEDLNRFLENIREIGGRSRECAESLLLCMQEAKGEDLKKIIGLTGEINRLDENGLSNIDAAFKDLGLVKGLLEKPQLLSKILLKLQGADYYEFTNKRMDSSGRIYVGEINPGCYKIMAEVTVGDGIKTISWSTETVGNDYLYIPKALRDEYDLKGGETIARLQIVKYIPEIYFPKSFANGILLLDFSENIMRLGGEQVVGSRFNPDEMLRDTRKGFAISVETSLKSATGVGRPLILRFYEDGSVSLVSRSVDGDSVDNIDVILLKNTLERLVLKEGGVERTVRLEEGEIRYLELESHGHKYIFPVKTLSYQKAKDYKVYVEGKDGKTIALLTYLKIIFGCDTIERIQEHMESGRLKLVATLEDGTKVTTRGPRLEVTTEGLGITSIGFYLPRLEPKYTFEGARNYLRRIGMKYEELVNKAVERYLEFIGYSAEEVESRVGDDINYLGDYGEWLIIGHDAPRVTGIHYRVYINGKPHTVDIVEEDKVVESKYWINEKSYKIRFVENPEAFNELVNELKVCKYVMEQRGLREVCLIFGKKVLDDVTFDNYMKKLRDALGSDTSWLKIFNGFEEYSSK